MKILATSTYSNPYKSSPTFEKGGTHLKTVQIPEKFQKAANEIIAEYPDYGKRQTRKAAECAKKLCELIGRKKLPSWAQQTLNKKSGFIYDAF